MSVAGCAAELALTSGVVAGSQEDASSCLPYPDDMAGCWCAQDAILADDELLDAVRGTDLCNQLRDFWIPITTVTTDDKCGTRDTLGNRLQNASYKSL